MLIQFSIFHNFLRHSGSKFFSFINFPQISFSMNFSLLFPSASASRMRVSTRPSARPSEADSFPPPALGCGSCHHPFNAPESFPPAGPCSFTRIPRQDSCERPAFPPRRFLAGNSGRISPRQPPPRASPRALLPHSGKFTSCRRPHGEARPWALATPSHAVEPSL